MFFQRAAVDSNANGDLLLSANIRHRFYPIIAAYVARVDANFVDPPLGSAQRQTIVKMNIRHQRHIHGVLDRLNQIQRRLVRNGKANYLAPGSRQSLGLRHRAVNVRRRHIQHGLYQHRAVAAQGGIA